MKSYYNYLDEQLDRAKARNEMKTFTRKEIAAANEISVKTVKRRERDLGLHECRDSACRKPIRYKASTASQTLSKSGWNVPV